MPDIVKVLLPAIVVVSATLAASAEQEAQDKYQFDADLYEDAPLDGLKAVSGIIQRAEDEEAGPETLAPLRLEAARLAFRARETYRGVGLLQEVFDEADALLTTDEGRRLYSNAVNLGSLTLQRLGDGDAAERLIREALQKIETVPDQPRLNLAISIRSSAADVSRNEGKHEEALEWIAPIFEKTELLLRRPEGAIRFAFAARQRGLLLLEAGKADEAFESLEDAKKQVEAAESVVEMDELTALTVLQERVLILADMSASEQRLSSAIEDADRLISRLETVAVEHRSRALRSAGGLCAAAVMALGDDATDEKLNYCNQVFRWMESEANLRDPEFGALSDAVSTADNLVRRLTGGDVETAFAVLHRAYRLLDLVESEHGVTAATERLRQQLERSAQPLESMRTRSTLIGRPAPPLACEAVVHQGRIDRSGLSWQDLRGKVVMLEFWNVHCGPCIKSFPKLAELESGFSRRDFVVLGQTHFYKMRWDKQLQAPVDDERATPEQELAMLVHFSEMWNAQHRLIVTSDHAIDARYGVSANPTAFLVDRRGVVRMAAVGTDEIESPGFRKMLFQLLDE